MQDRHNRKIDYLRISVTDRCNLRCTYCMPEEGIKLLRHEDVLNFDEIYEVAKTSVKMGVKKIRLTGGEPLIRKGIIDLVSMIAKIDGLNDFAMTTNGYYLKKYAKDLKVAGLKRVNISLDSVNHKRFSEITRGGDLDEVLEGIKEAESVGLTPIKINCVVNESVDEVDAKDVANFGKENGFEVRFIRKMNIKKGEYWKVIGGSGGDCKSCNRLRLTSSGYIKPCLFSDLGFSVREHGVQDALEMALGEKPERGLSGSKGNFCHIGG